MPIFLRDADIERVIPSGAQEDRTLQAQVRMWVDVRQARYPDLASQTAGCIHEVVQTNSRNGDAELEQRRLHRQRAGLRVCHDAVKSAQATGRERFPG